MTHHVNTLTGQIIGSAIEVHRALGPGLLESAYRLSLARELLLRSNIPVETSLAGSTGVQRTAIKEGVPG